MSGECGPGDADCREVLEEVYLYLDGELALEQRTMIKRHLDDCSPCLRKYGLEQDVRSLIARCCGGDRAPETLHQRIRARITEVTIETSHLEFRAE